LKLWIVITTQGHHKLLDATGQWIRFMHATYRQSGDRD